MSYTMKLLSNCQYPQAQPRRSKQLTEPQPGRWVTGDEARKNAIGGKEQRKTGYAEPESAGS